jgi:two-component system copper resistance phosphate regulon response regulator CusR
MRILLVEDDQAMADLVADKIRHQYAVDVAPTGAQGEKLAHENDYDVVIIDYNLPDMDGVALCKNLRTSDIKTPVLMLTGRSEIKDKVSALDAGADDYLTKPFSFEELSARIRALLRRKADTLTQPVLTIEDLTLDLASSSVTRGGNKIELRRKELQLLEYLMRNKGRTLSRNMIVEHIWDSNSDPLTNTVDVHIKYLRDRIDKPYRKKLIKTVYGLGYKIG